MKKIAVIEDDLDLFGLLRYNLEKEGFQMVGANTGKGAVSLCTRERPDLIILDIMLPDSDGFDICKHLRGYPELRATPIIFLTARASETDRLVGLELGANDYIVKPFFMREVISRIRVQLRNSAVRPSLLKAGRLELDRDRCRVRSGSRELSLTPTEFRLLEFFMARPDVVFSREKLLDAVWGNDRSVTDRTVDVYVLRLRQKLGNEDGAHQFIRAVRGFGYSFDAAGQGSEHSQNAMLS
jgi:DNA-binding response OmpR family regulator